MGTLRSGDAFASPLPATFSQRQLYLTNNLLRKSARQNKIEYIISQQDGEWLSHIRSARKESSKYNRTLLGFLTAGADINTFAFEADDSYHWNLSKEFEDGPVEVSQVAALMWKDIQRRLDPEVWSGSEYLYHAFRNTEITARNKNKGLI
jgi:hypothetical protein